MSRTLDSIKIETVAAARSRIGMPFRHHYKPDNLCNDGRQLHDHCWEFGLDDRGYDCSGLVIASLCDALGIATSQWPEDWRHIHQLVKASSVEAEPQYGDVVITLDTERDRWHAGVFTERYNMVHASGNPNELMVTEGPIDPSHQVSVFQQSIR